MAHGPGKYLTISQGHSAAEGAFGSHPSAGW